jgi:type IV secretory pathway VirB4 component
VKSILLGYDAVGRPIQLSPNKRQVHTHVIGSSGSGKSKFMEWMMRADLRNGQGFCLIDPHGTLYEDVAAYCAHHAFKREIILLNVSSPDAVIGFNPFQKSADGDVSVQVDRRISATLHAWNVKDADQTPTLARTLRLIYTVMLEQNVGLPQIAHLIDFNAKKIRAHLVDRLRSPLIQKEWRELQSLDPKDWRQKLCPQKTVYLSFLRPQPLLDLWAFRAGVSTCKE